MEFEIWPFQPRVKLSLSTMRPLIDIFSRCSCNVARSLASLMRSLSYTLSSAHDFPPSPHTVDVLFLLSRDLLAQRPRTKPDPNASTRGLAQPFQLIYSKSLARFRSLSLSFSLVPTSNSFLPSRKNDLTKLESALRSLPCVSSPTSMKIAIVPRIDESFSFRIYSTRSLRRRSREFFRGYAPEINYFSKRDQRRRPSMRVYLSLIFPAGPIESFSTSYSTSHTIIEIIRGVFEVYLLNRAVFARFANERCGDIAGMEV